MTKKQFYVEALKQEFYTCKVMAETKEEADELAKEMWPGDEAFPSHWWSDEQVEEITKGLEEGTWENWASNGAMDVDIGLDRETVWCSICYEQGKDTCNFPLNHKCSPERHVGTCDDCMTKKEE
jgi:hypothetical protein